VKKIKKAQKSDKGSNNKELIKTVLSDMRQREFGKFVTGLSTGLENLDWVLSGLRNGNLIVLAGHPYIGKNSLAITICNNLAIKKDIPILYFSMERAKEQVMEQMLLTYSRLELIKAVHGRLGEKEWDRLDKAASEIGKKPIFINDTARLAPLELREIAKTVTKSKGIKFIVVDNLQAMRLPDKIELDEKDFAEISSNLKLMALELNIPVMLLVQLNFDWIKAEDVVEPRLADFGKAISVERYADVMMIINRSKYYDAGPPDDTSGIISVRRNNNGSTGEVHLNFNEKLRVFEDIGH